MVCASARGVRRHMSCSSWAPEDDFGLRRLEHELVAIEREGAGSAGNAGSASTCHRLPNRTGIAMMHVLPTLPTLPTLQQIAAPVVC